MTLRFKLRQICVLTETFLVNKYTMEAALRNLLAAIILSAGTGFCSFLGPPCMSPLGLQLGANDYSLTFDLASSSGDANSIRMNGPKSWRPADVSGSFLEINISQPVLLSGLQVQGDPQETGQISGWLLDTSQDCETYRTESYALDPDSPVHTQTVYLKSVQFVACIRLRPTHFKGKSPDLRLELLGCVIEDNSVCDRDVHPVAELWLESGGRQLNFLHEIVISWVKILLELQALGNTGDAGIFYSRSCDDQWQYYEPSDTRVIAVTSPDQTSSWMTIDMDKPVRAKCLRIFPPFSTTLKEVHTSGCSAHVTTSLHEIRRNNNSNLDDTDIAAYQKDAPNDSSDERTDEDDENAKQTQVLHQEKDKTLPVETTGTNVKFWQKQDVDKVTTTNNIVTEDTDLPITETSKETPATSTATIPDVPEDTTASNITKELNSTAGSLPEPTQKSEDLSTTTTITKVSLPESTQKSDELSTTTTITKFSLPESTQKSVDINDTTVMLNAEITRDNEQNLTQSTEVNYNDTSLSSLFDKMVPEQPSDINISNDMPEEHVVTEGQQNTTQIQVENITISINNAKNNRSTIMAPDVNSTESTEGLLDKSVDTSSYSTAIAQHTGSTSSVPSTVEGMTVTQHTGSTSSFPSRVEGMTVTQHTGSTSSVPSTVEGMTVTQQTVNGSTSIQSEGSSSAFQSEDSSSAAYSNESASAVQSKKGSSFAQSKDSGSIVHYKDSSSIVSYRDSNSAVHSKDSIAAVNSEDSSSIEDSSENGSDVHPERNDSNHQLERNSSVTTDWWRSNCGVKNGAKGYRKKRVISGQRNIPGEWPWLVSMHFLPPMPFTTQSGFKHACGGSLIAPGWVLTAAHCFSDLPHDGLSNTSSWRVYFGLHDLAREDNQDLVQERLIEEFYSYPEYDISTEPLIYDVALVKLNEPVVYSDTVSPLCLDDTDIHYKETPCYVSGWGQHSHNSSGSRFPYTAFVSTMSPAMCKSKYDILPEEHLMKPYIRMTPPVLCARVGTSGEDACQGDSGGPLMCQHDGRWYQAGVVAAGYLCGQEATPGLYSRISYYIDWIKKTMADNESP